MSFMNDFEVADAIARARGNAIAAVTDPTRVDDEQAAYEAAREQCRQLGRINPAAQVADAALAVVTGARVVALDRDSLEPTSGELDTPGAIFDHYQSRYADGVGLLLGEQRHGGTLVAVRGTAQAWSEWVGEHGVERSHVVDDNGRVLEERGSYLDPGRHVRVQWSPAPISVRATPVAVGPAAIMAEERKVQFDRAGLGEVGWLCWSVGLAWASGANAGQRLTFPPRKRLGRGLEVLAEGSVLPLSARRGDGWTLSATGLPIETDLPAWLVNALGGTWVDVDPPAAA